MTQPRAFGAAIVALLVLCALPAAAGKDKDKDEDKDEDNDEKDKKDKKPKVKVSGFITAWYKFRIDQDDTEGTEPDVVRLGKVRVRFKGNVTDRVGYTVEIDPRSPTIFGIMRDAFISLKVIPGHEIRIGQQKTPFGYENGESSTKLYTITRTELSEGMGRGVTLRDIGVAVVGKWPLNDKVRLEDAVALVNGAGMGVQDDDTHMKNLWGRVGVRFQHQPAELTVRVGVSGAVGDQMGEADPGPPAVPAQRFEFKRVGADVTVDHPWFFAAAELAMGWDQIPADTGETESQMAYYLLVAGKTPWKVGPVLRYDAWDAEEWQRVTAGVYWGNPDDRVRVITHYEWFEDEGGAHDGRVLTQAMVRF